MKATSSQEREVSGGSARQKRPSRPDRSDRSDRSDRAGDRAARNDLGFILAAAVACAVVAASLIVLVGVRTAQLQAGYRVHDLEAEMLRLSQERAALDVERATLLRPQRLAELSRTTLGLVPVDASRVVPSPPTHVDVDVDVDDGGGAR